MDVMQTVICGQHAIAWQNWNYHPTNVNIPGFMHKSWHWCIVLWPYNDHYIKQVELDTFLSDAILSPLLVWEWLNSPSGCSASNSTEAIIGAYNYSVLVIYMFHSQSQEENNI